MILNENLLNDKNVLPTTFKKTLLSVYNHLDKEDRVFINTHITEFLPKETVIYLPLYHNQIVLDFGGLLLVLKRENYQVKYYDISVPHPATELDAVIVGNDIGQLYELFYSDEMTHYQFIIDWCTNPFTRPSTVYETFIEISKYIQSNALDSFIYPKAIAILSGCYDIIQTLRINAAGMRIQSTSLQNQALAFVGVSLSLAETCGGKRYPNIINDLMMSELNIMTSLVDIETVKKQRSFLESVHILHQGMDDISLLHLIKELEKCISNIEKRIETDPFVATPFTSYKNPNTRITKDIVAYHPISSRNLKNLIEVTTREAIKDLIEKKAGVLEDVSNITFDIPEKLLTMFQLEYSKEYPIMLIHLSETDVDERDGSDWRHTISCDNEYYIAFSMKDSENKLYAIHIDETEGDESCTILEFSGRDDGRYEFIYK